MVKLMTTNVRQNVQGLKYSAKEIVHVDARKIVKETCKKSVVGMV